VQFQPIRKTEAVRVTTKSGRSYDFNYAPLDVIQAATEPALSAEGLMLVSAVEPGPEGTVAVVTRLLHTSEQFIESRIPSGALEDVKALGGFVSYARRYNYLALLDLAGEDDVDGSQATGDHIEPRAKPASVPASNGHAPEPGEKSLEHPTESHLAALRNLAVTECQEPVDLYEDRLRTMMKIPKQASVSPRLLTKTMSMTTYMEIFAYYRRLEAQLAKGKEAARGNAPQEAAVSQPTAATPEAPPAVPSPAALSSAPEPGHGDAAVDPAYHKLYQEALGWGVAESEIRHILGHHEPAKARVILWKARRNEPPPTWVAAD
jgi:hypothetical protein